MKLMKLLAFVVLLVVAMSTLYASAPVAVQYQQLQPACDPSANLPTVLSSGCLFPWLKVTARPSNPNAIGLFVLVIYRSTASGIFITFTQFTASRDSSGEFIATFPSGDMSDVRVSATEVDSGDLKVATQAN